ncbi:hypothetical protein E2P81_ATG03546 [Venturia nashicola]|uniref:Uncharacterized protein n=1 Tax=Venturia nashicola TaxID=86259 RepID=A0A4Z1PBK4_9PEZI|nr:hypothetical protein E6O75_ATG03621 [Venturia nashicola]TLD37871.1 hypothetical protein E2P81_ATG03546 [Venturia nashicola]
MKLSFLLWAPLTAQAATIDKRQFGGLGSLMSSAASLFTTNMKATKTVEGLSAMKRQGVKNVRLYHGPLKLLPAEEASKIKGLGKSDPNSNTFMLSLQGLPQNTWILRTNSTLQYEDGRFATISNNVYNHHVQLIDVGKSAEQTVKCGKTEASDIKSGTKIPGGYIGGSAADGAPSLFTTPDGMFNSGYLLGTSSKVIVSAELVNYGKETKEVYLVTELDYLPGDTPDMMDTAVGIMTVNQCDSNMNPFLKAPEGKKVWDMKSKDLTISQDGYLLSRRGHMHDGGTGMVLKVNEQVVCDSKAEYGNDGSFKNADGVDFKALSGMKECNEPIAVKKGDNLKFEAYFDLEQHPARKHAHGGGEAEEMALMGYVFAFKRPGTKI